MATEFVGCTVLVTLHSPPSAQVRGVVLDISNQMLFLGEVYWLASGHHTPRFQVPSGNLADLEVLPEEPRDVRGGPSHHPRPSISPPQLEGNDSIPSSLRGSISQTDPIPAEQASPHHPQQPTNASLPFHDPAILSMADPAILSTSRPEDTQKRSKDGPPPIPRQMLVEAALGSPSKSTPAIPDAYLSARHPQYVRSDSYATLSEPFGDLTTGKSQDEHESEAAELGTDGGKEQATLGAAANLTGTKAGRRGKRAAKTKKIQPLGALPPHAEEVDSSPVQVKGQVQILRRKANKPESPSTGDGEAYAMYENGAASVKKSKLRAAKGKRRERLNVAETANGWATEDATDIQELGDFDFMANHAKFDKKEIFKQMRQEDTTADELRLVSHNRKPKPGTRGGLDLHWSENVLDVPHAVSNGVARWNSEAGESDEELEEARVSSGRDSRRAASRQNILRTASRKSSFKDAVSSSSVNAPVRPSVNTTARAPNIEVSSPRSKAQPGPSLYSASVSSVKPTLRVQGTNKPCPTLSPLQMLEFEQFAITELGLSEDILAENAARGIAQTAMAVLRDSNKNASFLKSHIIVAVGNHRSGARALAAARHLHCHGLRVTATLMGVDHADDMLDTVRQQLHAFRKAGGTVTKSAALLASLKAGTGSVLPNLIIDALLGIHTIFDDLRGDDQAWYYELVLLVNRNEWRVLSVEVPSGLDAVTGEMSHTDAAPSQALAFFPCAVVSLGAPKPWILATLRESPPTADSEPALYVADLGISNIVWKRLGNRRSKGVEFGGEWVCALRYQPGGE